MLLILTRCQLTCHVVATTNLLALPSATRTRTDLCACRDQLLTVLVLCSALAHALSGRGTRLVRMPRSITRGARFGAAIVTCEDWRSLCVLVDLAGRAGWRYAPPEPRDRLHGCPFFELLVAGNHQLLCKMYLDCDLPGKSLLRGKSLNVAVRHDVRAGHAADAIPAFALQLFGDPPLDTLSARLDSVLAAGGHPFSGE